MSRKAAAVGVAVLGIAVGVFSLALARDDPNRWFAGTSPVAGVALLAAGWALIGSGLASWVRRPGSRFGLLLAPAGFAWFLLEWNRPNAGSAVAFTLGLCLYAAGPPLVAHALLAYPGGRLAGGVERVAVAAGYAACLFFLGLLPALLFDPQAQGCTPCPTNLVTLSDRGELWEGVNRVGVYAGLGSALALAALAGWKLVRTSMGSRAVLAPGAAYLALAAAWFGASIDEGLLADGTLERRLWLAQAAALILLPAGLAWSWLRRRSARAKVARLVVDLAQSPPPGGLRDVLAATVGDPDLVLAYPLAGTGGLVDALGQPVELESSPEETRLVRDGQVVAAVGHRPGGLDDEQLVEEVVSAARLALENERLQAEVRARLDELRASRARIVEAGDAERKRLERDLHDGAQQRLVGLLLSLRLSLSELAGRGDAEAVARLEAADAELREAIAELRELAHGIFPAVLADEGFAAAVEALAEDGRIPFRIRGLPDERCAPPVETTAYLIVAEAARAATGGLVVEANHFEHSLLVRVEARGASDLDIVALQDRVGALEGSLTVEHAPDGHLTIRAELPSRP